METCDYVHLSLRNRILVYLGSRSSFSPQTLSKDNQQDNQQGNQQDETAGEPSS